MDHRSAVRDAGGERAAGALGMGRTGLQRSRSAAESDQSVLDVAVARNTAPASPRRHRLYGRALLRARAVGAVLAVAIRLDARVSPACDALRRRFLAFQAASLASTKTLRLRP